MRYDMEWLYEVEVGGNRGNRGDRVVGWIEIEIER